MSDLPAQPQGAPTIHSLAFHGRGAEYFRIWIVNLALSVITLGVYSAWAKVRARRYFAGCTMLDGHPFEYRGSAWRILLGRAIAAVLFTGCAFSVFIAPLSLWLWVAIFAAVLPWLVNASIRFNARSLSWRNVGFNFGGTYREAFVGYVVWTAAALLIFPLPYARRVQDYFYINHHCFGGRGFRTSYSGPRVYAIYLFGFILIVAMLLAVLALAAGVVVVATRLHNLLGPFNLPVGPDDFSAVVGVLFSACALFVAKLVTAQAANLAIGSTTLEGGLGLSSRVSGLRVAWIVLSNVLLTMATLGLYHPFGRVRLARYRMARYAVVAAGDLDAFAAEALETQSALGPEIASPFGIEVSL